MIINNKQSTIKVVYSTETVCGLPVAQFRTCSPTNHRMAGFLICYFIVYKMFSFT